MASTFSQDFPGTTSRVGKLHEELVADPGITTAIESVQLNPSGFAGTRIVWSTAPSSAEKTAAAAVVAVHDPTPMPRSLFLPDANGVSWKVTVDTSGVLTTKKM